MWWCPTDCGLQRLTQSRGETSSSLTADGLDHGVDHFKWALVGPTKPCVTINCPSFSDVDVKRVKTACTHSCLFLTPVTNYLVCSTLYTRHPGQYFARDVVNTSLGLTHVT